MRRIHECRAKTSTISLPSWEFEKGKREINVRVDGQLVFNSSYQILRAALGGLGVAYLPEDMVALHLEEGHLKRVLEDWCARFPGYHLYYPSRRQSSPAFNLLVQALRYKRLPTAAANQILK